jgi:hypothetical protein
MNKQINKLINLKEASKTKVSNSCTHIVQPTDAEKLSSEVPGYY